jgi:hypothetical protein
MFQQYGRYDFGVQPIYMNMADEAVAEYTPEFDFQAQPEIQVTSFDLNPSGIVNKMDDILLRAKEEGQERNKGTNYHDLYIQHSSHLKSIEVAALNPLQATVDIISKMNFYFEKHWVKIAPSIAQEYRNLLKGLDLEGVEEIASSSQQDLVYKLKKVVKEGISMASPWYYKPVIYIAAGGLVLTLGALIVLRKR